MNNNKEGSKTAIQFKIVCVYFESILCLFILKSRYLLLGNNFS